MITEEKQRQFWKAEIHMKSIKIQKCIFFYSNGYLRPPQITLFIKIRGDELQLFHETFSENIDFQSKYFAFQKGKSALGGKNFEPFVGTLNL